MKDFPQTSLNRGYFYHLATTHLQNLKEYVQVTPSSIDKYQDRDPYSIIYNIDDSDVSFLTEESDKNQYILLEILKGYFSLSSYLIRSPDHDPYEWPHLKNWTLYGSTNKNEWEVLDRRKTSELNGKLITKTFQCQYNCNNFYKYFLIYQEEVGYEGTYGFGFRRLDLFGSLINGSEYSVLFGNTVFYHQKLLCSTFLSIFISK